jgi:hypothetical protein
MNAPSKKNLAKKTSRCEAVPRNPRAQENGLPPTIGRAYVRFLELPPLIVLAMMWMVAVALLGSLALVMCLTAWVLVQVVAGPIWAVTILVLTPIYPSGVEG